MGSILCDKAVQHNTTAGNTLLKCHIDLVYFDKKLFLKDIPCVQYIIRSTLLIYNLFKSPLSKWRALYLHRKDIQLYMYEIVL